MPSPLKRYFKKYLKKILICALFLAFSVPAASELYQYTDENGITRLTNNIYSVPAKDRHRLEPFSEFTPLTSDIKIKSLEKKSTPPAAVETVIHPKTFKTQPDVAETVVPPHEKEIPSADETPEIAAAPAPTPTPTIDPEKSLQTPDIDQAVRESHKSHQVMIEKKSTPDIRPDIKSDTPKGPVAEMPKQEISPQAIFPSAQPPLNHDTHQSEETEIATEPLPTIEKPAPSPEITRPPLPAQAVKPTEKPESVSAGPETAISDEPAESALIDAKQDPPLDLALLESTQKKLFEKKTALNLKFQSLMQEKQEIENSVNEDDEESVLAYNDRVKKLNMKIKAYNLEKKILQAQIEKYNQAIERITAN